MNPLPKPQSEFPSNHTHGYKNHTCLQMIFGVFFLPPPSAGEVPHHHKPYAATLQHPGSHHRDDVTTGTATRVEAGTTQQLTRVEAGTTQLWSCPSAHTAPKAFVSRRGMIIAAA